MVPITMSIMISICMFLVSLLIQEAIEEKLREKRMISYKSVYLPFDYTVGDFS